MGQSLRISNKVKNLMIYLSNNLIFSIVYIMFMAIILTFFIFSGNIILYFLFCFMIEGSFIMSSIRITNNMIIKRNKLRYVIFSSFAPIIYPLVLLSTFIDIFGYKIIAYLFNLDQDIIKNGKCMFIFIIVYVISMLISIILSILIVKKYKKKLIRKNDNDLKIICK